MDTRFTESSKAALRLANEVASELGYNYVGSEHILAGIIREGTSAAAAALAEQGVDFDGVVEKITQYNAPGGGFASASLPLTPRSKALLEISFNEAKKSGSLLIEPEHILMAMLREGQSVAVRILTDYNVDFNALVQSMFGSARSGGKSGGTGAAGPNLAHSAVRGVFGRRQPVYVFVRRKNGKPSTGTAFLIMNKIFPREVRRTSPGYR